MQLKDWSASYEDLLVRFDLLTLKQRRKLLKLCFLYQVRSGSFFFPNAPVSASPMDPRLRNFNPSRLRGPTPHTLVYASSFFPDAVTLWNKLPAEVASAPSLSIFKRYVHDYLPYLI